MKNRIFYSVIFCCALVYAYAQSDTVRQSPAVPQTEKNAKLKYYRQEEILFEGKRYRLYNNYVTLGPVLAASSIRTSSQKGIGVDFNWHIRRQYFQTGFMMSGLNFGDNNHVSGHLTAGVRKERNFYNLAAFIGPCYSYGVEGDITTGPKYYSSFGAYISAQYAVKLSYDVGIGIEAFSEVSYKQFLTGVKIIAFFSGAYRGPKRNYNPNVRAENPKWQK